MTTSFTDFAEKTKALREAQVYVSVAVLVGRTIGGLVSLLPWWLSGAPWWAIPVFAIIIGWLGGRIYGAMVFRSMRRILLALYPEMKL